MPEIRRSGYLLAAVLLAAVVCSYAWKAPDLPRPRPLPSSITPVQIGGYSGSVGTVPEITLEALKSAQVIDRQYTSSDGFTINFALIGGTDRDALHDPRSCLLGSGGRIENDRLEALPGSGEKVRACDVIYDGSTESRADIVYYYLTKQGIVASATDIRLRLLSTAFSFTQNQQIYFIRFSTPVPDSPDSGQRQLIHSRLMNFAAQLWREMGPVLIARVDRS